MVAFGSIIPLEQGGRRVFGMSWMPVSGVCIGSRVERAVRDASRTHFHVGTGISWNLETPGVSRKKQRAPSPGGMGVLGELRPTLPVLGVWGYE